MAVRINGNALDTDKRTDSKYLLTLHMVNSALSMNGVNTYFGFDAKVYFKKTYHDYNTAGNKFNKINLL